jgi:hypothetical protein
MLVAEWGAIKKRDGPVRINPGQHNLYLIPEWLLILATINQWTWHCLHDNENAHVSWER